MSVIEHSVRPIDQYPGTETPTWKRQRSPFRQTWGSIMDLLSRELRYLSAKQVILEIDVRPMDLRIDGGLRANARPQGPRVVVSFQSKHGPMRWPCDTFTIYEHNLYAIALTLEKLRAIDRYGVAMKGEQYRGFTAIPASTSVTTKVNAAWAILERESGHEPGWLNANQRSDRDMLNSLFREAALRSHPDAGGTDERMSSVNRARDTILADLLT